MTQPPNPNVPNGQPFDPNQIPTDPQQAAAWAQQQQAAAWQQQQAAWQQQAAQEAQEQAHQEYLEQQAAEAKKSGGLGLRGIISIIVGVVVVGAGAWGLYQKFQTDQALKEGKCVTLSGSNTDAEPKEVDCDKEDYSWKVVSVVATRTACPTDTSSLELTSQSRRGGATRTDKVACLAPMLKENQCYKYDQNDVNEFIPSSSCTSGDLKVNKIVDDPEATCEAPAEALAFESLKRTYCIEQVA